MNADDLELLRRRTRALAAVQRQEHATRLLPVVMFTLAEEAFALDAAVVLEVAVLRDLMPLPGAAVPYLGATHWRGDALIVLDLRDMLGVRSRGITDLSRIIVVEGVTRPFGLIADAVHEVTDLDEDGLHAGPVSGAGHAALVRGVTADAVTVIDARRLVDMFGGARARPATTG